jgi:hypothetical protein
VQFLDGKLQMEIEHHPSEIIYFQFCPKQSGRV